VTAVANGGLKRFVLGGIFFDVAVLFVGLSIVLVNVVNAEEPSTAPSPAATTPAGDGGTQTVAVTLSEFAIEPAEITVEAGPIEFAVSNAGVAQHNFAIEGVASGDMLDGGSSGTLAVEDLAPGQYRFLCEVPGHAESGMEGTLTVAEADGGNGGEETPTPTGSPSPSHEEMTPEEMAADMVDELDRYPEPTEGKGNQPLEPQIVDGVKVFELTADEISWETKAGVFKDGYAYNGQIPGPQIRVQKGDRVRIVLTNEMEVPTALHLHGMIVPNDMDGVPGLTQDSIMPGDSFTYEFTVKNTGSNMYHSHFDAAAQVPMGLLGAFLVDDPRDPEVDLDYTMVLNDGPLGFTFNGKDFPATEPLVVNQGDLVRIRYMNEGFQIHPMHLHGMPQEVIAIDGHLLDDPYMADTVVVAPGQRVDVLVRSTELGAWAFHCHILNHAETETGMFGMVTALIVQ
jgi:uncharacterized cupredoxin-like copper-binding protein